MSTPLSMECSVGYVEAEDAYVMYSEYYGDGTIYGRVDILDANGEAVRGAGKCKRELVDSGAVISDSVLGAVTGDLVVTPNEPVSSESSAPAPEEAAPAPAPEEAAPAAEEASPYSGKYTINAFIAGFAIIREFNVKIDEASRIIYLSE